MADGEGEKSLAMSADGGVGDSGGADAAAAGAGKPATECEKTGGKPAEDIPTPCEITTMIGELKKEQDALRAAKKKISKDLRNAVKRRSRLKKRARQLSDADLLQVLKLRSEDRAAVGACTKTASGDEVPTPTSSMSAAAGP